MLSPAVLASVLFLIISAPFMYKITNSIFGRVLRLSDDSGRPTVAGLVVHTLVFYVLFMALRKI